MEYSVFVDNFGNVTWYKKDTKIIHRQNGPAVEFANGDKHWYKEGKLHRENGPAIECLQNNLGHPMNKWFFDGKEYTKKEFDKILKIDDQLEICYSVFVDYLGNKSWYKAGTTSLHREDGPAVEMIDGSKEWWLNGFHLKNEEEFNKAVQKWTPEDLNLLGKCFDNCGPLVSKDKSTTHELIEHELKKLQSIFNNCNITAENSNTKKIIKTDETCIENENYQLKIVSNNKTYCLNKENFINIAGHKVTIATLIHLIKDQLCGDK